MTKEIVTTVVGLSHYMDNYDDFCDNLVKGSHVYVQYEPNNSQDEHALLVTMPNGKSVGHITREDSHQVHAGVGNKMVIGRVISGKHKAFKISLMVNAEAFDAAEISTDIDDIETKLPEGVIGLRNALPVLLEDNLMEQAWTNIVCGREYGDDAMVKEGVNLFRENYGCSLCIEDQMRACKIQEWGLDADGAIRKITNDLGKVDVMHKCLMKQIQGMTSINDGTLNFFRDFYVKHGKGESYVQQWLDTVLDGMLKGIYKEVTEEMAAQILYHKLSRADIYIILSHLIAITKPETLHVEVEEKLCTDENEEIKMRMINRFMKLTLYLQNIDEETYKSKLMGMLDLSINDIHTEGRKELWKLLTKPFPRDNKQETVFDRIVVMNIVGYLIDKKYLLGEMKLIAEKFFLDLMNTDGNKKKKAADEKKIQADIKNMGRAFDKAKRYTNKIKNMVKYYFP